MKHGIIDKILQEWLWRLDDPTTPDPTNQTHLYHLNEALQELDLSEDFISEFVSNLTEKEKKKKDDNGPDNNYEELMNQTIKNPETGEEIKIKSALEKDANEPVYKAAKRELDKLIGNEDEPGPEDDSADDDKISYNGKTYDTTQLTNNELEKLKQKTGDTTGNGDELTKSKDTPKLKSKSPIGNAYKENKNSETFKAEFKTATQQLKNFTDEVESARVATRIDNSKQTIANLESVLEPDTPILPGDKKRTIADTLFSKSTLKYRVEVPSAQRGLTIDKLANDFETKGYTVTTIKRGGVAKGVVIEKDGVKEQIDVKPTAGKKSRAEALAFEASVALAFGIAASGGNSDDAANYTSDLMEGHSVTAGDVNVSIKNLRGDALNWMQNAKNAPIFKGHLDMLLKNQEEISVNLAASKRIITDKFPAGTKMSIECEGGADTDEFRADVVTYATTPDGNKVALLGISVKDGGSQTLGQLGARKAGSAIESTQPNTPERKAALGKYFEVQSSKLPEAMRSNYENKLVSLDDPSKLHTAMVDSIMESDDPNIIHDMLIWSIVGTGDHSDLAGFIYQNASRTYTIPLPGSDKGKKIKNCVANMMKSGKFKKVKRNDSTDDIMMEVDGNLHPVMTFRTKKTASGQIDRSYMEKGGARSVTMPLLNGKYCK